VERTVGDGTKGWVSGRQNYEAKKNVSRGA